MDAHDLSPGDRVALLVPGSVAYAELVIALLRRGVFPVPMDAKLTRASARHCWPTLDPTLVVTTQEQLEDLLAALPDDPSLGRPWAGRSTSPAAPRADRRACSPGCSNPTRREALLAEERELWGFAADDVNLVLSPIHHSAPLRFAMGTLLARRRGGAARALRPGRRSTAAIRERAARRRCSAYRPTSSGCSRTGTSAARPTSSCFRLVAHAGAPCPEWVKRRLIEEFPDGVDVGVLRLHGGPVHRLPERGVAGAAGHAGPGPAGTGDDGRRGRPPVVRRTCRTRGSATSATRRRPRRRGARPPDGTGLHGR